MEQLHIDLINRQFVSHLWIEHLRAGAFNDGYRPLTLQFRVFLLNPSIHFLVFLQPLGSGIACAERFMIVIIDGIPCGSPRAYQKKRHKKNNVLFAQGQLVHTAFYETQFLYRRNHRPQKNSQQHGFDREKNEVFGDANRIKQRNQAFAADENIVSPHNGGLKKDIHKKADAETRKNHPDSRNIRAVKKQSKNDRTGDFRKNKGEIIGALRKQNGSQRI